MPVERSYPDNGPVHPAYAKDNSYRDLCISSPDLTAQDFDPKTGEVKPRKIPEKEFFISDVSGAKPGFTCMPKKNTPKNSLTGFSNDPKPYTPAKKTPLSLPGGISVDTNHAFAWHLNLGDAMTAEELNQLSGIYKWNVDYSLSSYLQMVGGSDYCPPLLWPNFCFEAIPARLSTECPVPAKKFTDLSDHCPGKTASECDTIKLAWFRMAQERKCAETYIGLRGMKPWFVYEKLGFIWEQYLLPKNLGGNSGDPEEPPVRYCQPLIRGDQAEAVYRLGNSPDKDERVYQRDMGYAQVFRDGKHPWADEAEYTLGGKNGMLAKAARETLYYTSALDRDWGARLPKELALPLPETFPAADLPCLRDLGEAAPTPSPMPSPAPSPAPAPSPGPSPAYYPAPHPAPQPPMPSPAPAPAPVKPFDPCAPRRQPPQTHSPAQDSLTGSFGDIMSPGAPPPVHVPPVTPPPGSNAGNSNGGGGQCKPHFPIPSMKYKHPPVQGPRYCLSVEKYNDATHPFSPRQRFDGTDTDYSDATSKTVSLKINGQCTQATGYTAYQKWDAVQKASNPVVQCGIVPVDILEFRQDTFDRCMSQRINQNLNSWVERMTKDAVFAGQYIAWWDAYDGSKPPYDPDATGGSNPPSPFAAPCATRYHEQDDPNICYATWSVQQCCAYAAHPVVPTNFIKIETDYGVRDALQKAADPASPTHDEELIYPLVEPHYLDPTATGSYKDDVKANQKLHALAFPAVSGLVPDDALFYFWFPMATLPEDPTKLLGSHLPPMRRYDTGAQAGQSKDDYGKNDTSFEATEDSVPPLSGGQSSKARRGASFSNTLFSYDVAGIVGDLGRTEQEAKAAGELAAKAKPEKQDFEMQWVKKPKLPELGAYGLFYNRLLDQGYNFRYNRMFCVPRNEVAFKDFDQDDFPLAKLGADFTLGNGSTQAWKKGFRGYGSNSFVEKWLDSNGNLVSGGLNQQGFPFINNDNPMTGLVSAHGTVYVSPRPRGLPGQPDPVGLDLAQPDDIIIYNVDGVPRTAYVVMKGTYPNVNAGVACLTDPKNCFEPAVAQSTRTDFLVVESMGGKHYSSTGVPDAYGLTRRQILFKDVVTLREGRVAGQWEQLVKTTIGAFKRGDATSAFFPVGSPYHVKATPLCNDSNYMGCSMPQAAWQKAIVWRALANHNDCTEPGINQVPPGQTDKHPAGLFEACFNQGADAPSFQTSLYSWFTPRSGGYSGTGTSDFLMNPCPPDYIRKPATETADSRWKTVVPQYVNPADLDGAWGSCPSAANTVGLTGKNTPLPKPE